MYFDLPHYGAPDYRHHDRFLVQELRDLEVVTRRLLDPLFTVVSTRDHDPFEASRKGRG